MPSNIPSKPSISQKGLLTPQEAFLTLKIGLSDTQNRPDTLSGLPNTQMTYPTPQVAYLTPHVGYPIPHVNYPTPQVGYPTVWVIFIAKRQVAIWNHTHFSIKFFWLASTGHISASTEAILKNFMCFPNYSKRSFQ